MIKNSMIGECFNNYLYTDSIQIAAGNADNWFCCWGHTNKLRVKILNSDGLGRILIFDTLRYAYWRIKEDRFVVEVEKIKWCFLLSRIINF